MEIYTVRPGDSLSSIARSYGLEAESIRQLNQLSDPRRLSPGLSLVLDAPARKAPESVELCAFLSPRADRVLLAELLPSLSWLSIRGCRLAAQAQLELPDDRELLSLAARHSVLPLLSLGNVVRGGYSALLAHQLLCSRETSACLIPRLVELLSQRGYRGLELNFQYLLSFDLEAYSEFAGALAQALHAAGLYLFVSLAPKTAASEQSPLCAGQDYLSLGRLADRVILLCHDWGGIHTAPQAISPADRVAAVLDYALPLLPPGKTLLSLSCCGCSWYLPWRQGEEGQLLSSALAADMAVSAGAEVKFDRSSRSPFFTCSGGGGRRRLVWYEDARSLSVRMDLALERGLAGLNLRSRDRLCRPGLKLLLSRCAGEKLI